MEFSEFTQSLGAWCDGVYDSRFECWVDGARFRITPMGQGLRCSLDMGKGWELEKIIVLLGQAGAGFACGCRGALAFDPRAHTLVLVEHCRLPLEPSRLIVCLEGLANQRAAMLNLADHHDQSGFVVSTLQGIAAHNLE